MTLFVIRVILIALDRTAGAREGTRTPVALDPAAERAAVL